MGTVPAVAKRERVGLVLSQGAEGCDVKLQGAANANVGQQGNLQLARNAA